MGWIHRFVVRSRRQAEDAPPRAARSLAPVVVAILTVLVVGGALAFYEVLAGGLVPILSGFGYRLVAIAAASAMGGAVALMFSSGYRRVHNLGLQALAEKEALADTVRLHDRAMAESGNGIVIADARSAGMPIVYANPAFERYAGFSSGEALGKKLTFYLAHDQDQLGKAELRHALDEGVPTTVTLKDVRDDATTWYEFAVSPVHDSAGSVSHFVGVLNDITPVVAHRDSLASLNAGLESTVAERTAALEESHSQLLRQYDRLQALQMIDLAIRSCLDVDLTLNIIARHAQALLEVDAVGFLVLTRGGDAFRYAATCGYRSFSVGNSRLPVGSWPAAQSVSERRAVQIADVGSAYRSRKVPTSWEGEEFVAYVGMPLIAKGKVCGVIEILSRSQTSWDHEWFQLAGDLVGRATVALDAAALLADLQEANDELVRAYDATLEGWVNALDLRDRETEGHTQRVTQMTLVLAEELGVPASELPHIRRGALLHDIGKIGIPDSVLLKPASLDHNETAIMRMHPVYAYRWLSRIPFLSRATEIPYCHHEKWDGTGYPRQLEGEDIPISARIFAVVDVWDALRSDRPYREGWPEEKVLAHIESEAGTHFDPSIVRAFLEFRRRTLGQVEDEAA